MRKIHNLKTKERIRKKLRNSPTPHEIILWSRLRRSQLGYKFRRQQSIGEYIVDFYCSSKQLVVEVEGWQHKENIKYDKKRNNYLKNLGIKTLRFWNNEINNNLENVVFKIEEYLK
ncbi:hypothetical protein BMS3Abin15_01061 [bacterium BMS3Abin15]|nr:hypothetical protein BMS3Abin15_01061 [bacterium BMS3Abin15]HDH07799.1 endonuclease domain-containing protein [Candidatus Moranbacteria bacterium]HDZ85359.1 endonuclease domain-containing protein [Candidatus Moranbacteria bacterium]